jgi:hypothetical protein
MSIWDNNAMPASDILTFACLLLSVGLAVLVSRQKAWIFVAAGGVVFLFYWYTLSPAVTVWEWTIRILALIMALVLSVILAAVISRKQERHWPILSYLELSGDEKWLFEAPMDVCFLQVLHIKNTQVSVPNTAKKVNATIEYKHDDGRNKFNVRSASWKNTNRNDTNPTTGGPRLVSGLNLESNEAQKLIVTMQHKDGRVFASPEINESFEDLAVGHWKAKVKITCDNARGLTLHGGFTVFPDEGNGRRLAFDRPAFKVERRWTSVLRPG